MKRVYSPMFVLLFVPILSPTILADEKKDEEKEEKLAFVSLFNEKDLAGWVPINVRPDTFQVRDAMIVCSGKPTGVMRTDKMYENFILELEWRHMRPKGNAGLFIWSDGVIAPGTPFTRSIEVQILDGRNTENYTSHGDVFAIHGAKMKPDRPHPAGSMRCLPSERRSKPSPEWNHYRVTCRDGDIKLAVNGKCRVRRGARVVRAKAISAWSRKDQKFIFGISASTNYPPRTQSRMR